MKERSGIHCPLPLGQLEDYEIMGRWEGHEEFWGVIWKSLASGELTCLAVSPGSEELPWRPVRSLLLFLRTGRLWPGMEKVEIMARKLTMKSKGPEGVKKKGIALGITGRGMLPWLLSCKWDNMVKRKTWFGRWDGKLCRTLRFRYQQGVQAVGGYHGILRCETGEERTGAKKRAQMSSV